VCGGQTKQVCKIKGSQSLILFGDVDCSTPALTVEHTFLENSCGLECWIVSILNRIIIKIELCPLRVRQYQ
jgi:hypothetical protein